MLENACVANCTCCKLHVLQILCAAKSTWCKFHVLQIVCFVNWMFCKLHVLKIACVENCMHWKWRFTKPHKSIITSFLYPVKIGQGGRYIVSRINSKNSDCAVHLSQKKTRKTHSTAREISYVGRSHGLFQDEHLRP